MKTYDWNSLAHKNSIQDRARIKQEAVAELDRIGYAALRKARALTQVELAEKLGVPQGSVSAIESRTNHHLSTLARYVSAMGGELRLQAVFPEATFNLDIKAGLAKAKVRSNAVQTKVMKPAVQGKTMATRPVKRVLRRAA